MLNRKKFPWWIHVVLGLIWIFVGITFHIGTELIIWVIGGLVMLGVGLLNRG
ncbi:MAG: hypothetical protein KAS02_01605 [Candidatus Pacebacteria bacterium]|nr:hypothetical protein [Candidatus Paceibacterota bacterium]